jgi:AraC-like DNA-binding protein
MIAGCNGWGSAECAGCEHADPCRHLFAWMAGRPDGSGAAAQAGAGRAPLLQFLGMVSRTVGRWAEESQKRAPAPRPASEFRKRVEAELARELESGAFRIEQVARALGTSRQTLYRRLKAEGVTFAELLDRVRRRLAIRLLRDDGLSVKETAYRLGFSDPAAFSRAFKRWTGKSPRDVQRR